eukprot:SAG31_NODE_2271_length_6040_cov_3.379397_3_plen_67_part_00
MPLASSDPELGSRALAPRDLATVSGIGLLYGILALPPVARSIRISRIASSYLTGNLVALGLEVSIY